MKNTEIGIMAIVGVCVLVLIMGLIKKKAEFLLSFGARIVVCGIVVYFLNSFLISRGLQIAIGFNMLSFLTFGTLGVSGMAALYGILFLQLL